jgi:hypothetical protein
VRSTTFLFTTLSTSVQKLGENGARSGLRWNVCAGPERAPRCRPCHACRAALRLSSASGPTRPHPVAMRLSEVPHSETGSNPRRLEVPRATRRVAAHACQLLPVLPAGHTACPPAAHCFEAKPPCPTRQLAYLRPPRRLARPCWPSPRAPPSRHGRCQGELLFLLTPSAEWPSNALHRSHRSSEPCVLPRSLLSLPGH